MGFELLAVNRLDDQPAARDKNPAKLTERALVPVVTQVPERRAKAENGVLNRPVSNGRLA